jgi:hypothetical protein
MSEVTKPMPDDAKQAEGEKSSGASSEKTTSPVTLETNIAGKAAPAELKEIPKAADPASPAKPATASKSPSAPAQPNKKVIPPAPDTTTRFGAKLEDPELQLSHIPVSRVWKRVLLVGLVALALVVGAELLIRSVFVPANMIHRAVSQQAR